MSGRHVSSSTADPGDGETGALRDDGGGDGVERDGNGQSSKPDRRRVLLIAAIGLVVVVAAVAIYALISDRQQSQVEPEIPDPITTTLPVPTSTGEPIEPSGESALAQGLPTEVLDHVLTAQESDEDAFADHGAVEGWFLTYSAPGSDVEVHVLQWEETEDAVAFAENVVADQVALADGEGRRSGDVAVDGESVGRYEIGVVSDAQEPGDPSTPADDDAGPVATPEPLGAGIAVWSNGPVAFVATGDAARLAQFYDNFPF